MTDEQITIRNGWIVPFTHGFIFTAALVVFNVVNKEVTLGAWLILFSRASAGICLVTFSISQVWLLLDFLTSPGEILSGLVRQ